MNARYIRLFSDETGESHFAEVEVPLVLSQFAPNSPALGLSEFKTASRMSFLGGPNGWTSNWHPSSARNLFVVLSGEWEIQASDGQTRVFSPCDVLLIEDTSGKGHRSRVRSNTDSLAILVELS
ncbi:MAG TPA: hypothetical protein VJT50_06710 [Pyrinomonadaceae bacterium]|nr:hypothetical protein [Pyrinomonadaceae bacterium]